MAESTPFLAPDHGDDYDQENHPIQTAPANSHFKLPIKILTSFVSFFSISMTALLVAAYVLVKTGDYSYSGTFEELVRDLAIVLFVNFLVMTPLIFLQLPIILHMAIDLTMGVVCLVFAITVLADGWPSEDFCRRWEYPRQPPYGRIELPVRPGCFGELTNILILTGLGAGLGIFVGLLILTTMLLRLVAVARTKFWVGKNYVNFKAWKGWKPKGFTVQFTLSILPSQEETACGSAKPTTKDVDTRGSEEQTRLIET